MLLREYLPNLTKEELLQQARNFEIKKCTGLRKAELIDRIVENFCTEDMLRTRLSCLTNEQLELFRKAYVTPQKLTENEFLDGIELCEYWVGCFDEVTDKFCVFDDVREVFLKIDDELFRTEQYKKGWMLKCVRFFVDYYGIAPVEILYELYRQKVKDTMEAMLDIFWEMPVDIVKSCVFTKEQFGLQSNQKNDPIYSETGLFIYLPLLENQGVGYLLGQQSDKKFYIPSVKQIEELYKSGYEASSDAYKKLQSFFMNKLSMPYEVATSWCYHVWDNSYTGESPVEVMHELTEAKIVFQSEKQMNEFVGLLMTAHNHTRMRENRGHKPSEIARREFAGGMPTIVPGSSQAAAILKEAAPQLQAMGIPLDLDGSADYIPITRFPNGLNGEAVQSEHKVYPNDLCPCGSGKKYKKCCGKNR